MVSVGVCIIFLGALFALCAGFGLDCTESPCLLDDKSIRFFVLGDWGGMDTPPYVTPGQQACADMTSRMGPSKNPQFFISTGNNFYKTGVQNVEDPRFKTTFDDVFLYGKETSVPWYLIAGNHDWFGNITAQFEYTLLNKRWVFPSYAYSAQFDARPQGPAVDIIYIDTVILCGNAWDDDADDSEAKSEKNEFPQGPENKEWSDSLWTWIEEQMANSTADYLLVVGHYPTFSADRHGVSECLVPRLQNLMETYNATAYISGHAHNLQHLKTVSPSGKTLHHIVSGGGRMVAPNSKSYNLTDDTWQIKNQFFYPRQGGEVQKTKESRYGMGGLVYIDLGTKSGAVEYYSCDGDGLYRFDVEGRN